MHLLQTQHAVCSIRVRVVLVGSNVLACRNVTDARPNPGNCLLCSCLRGPVRFDPHIQHGSHQPVIYVGSSVCGFTVVLEGNDQRVVRSGWNE